METAIKLTLLEAVGDYGSKIQSFPLTMLGYNTLAVYLFQVMGQSGATITLVNSYWDGVSNIATTLMGFLLGERFTEKQYLGIAMITIGLFLL